MAGLGIDCHDSYEGKMDGFPGWMGAEILAIWAGTSPRVNVRGTVCVGERGDGVIQVHGAPSFRIPSGLFVFERL